MSIICSLSGPKGRFLSAGDDDPRSVFRRTVAVSGERLFVTNGTKQCTHKYVFDDAPLIEADPFAFDFAERAFSARHGKFARAKYNVGREVALYRSTTEQRIIIDSDRRPFLVPTSRTNAPTPRAFRSVDRRAVRTR